MRFLIFIKRVRQDRLNNDILLKFDRVSVDYTSPSGSLYRAVNDINLAIRKGETLGIVR